MASPSGSKNLALARRSVEELLFAEPYNFEFFQAVRLLQLLYPNRAKIGLFQSPSSESVRIGAVPTLSFPASQIQSLEANESGAPPAMRVNFMGLVGPVGQLPLYYTELVADRVQARDRTLRDFLDIFQHRAISFFYRAWEKYRFLVPYERGEEKDRFTSYLLSTIGLGIPSLQQRQLLSDDDFLYYGGLLAQQPRSAEGLQLMLQDYFGVPVKVEQFLGAWYRLDREAQCNLDDNWTDSQQLGFGTVVGDEIWDPQSHVRVSVGPLTRAQYQDFLPTGTAFLPLKTMVRFYAGDELDFEAQLILRKEETPGCELGGSESPGPQLGWVSWLKTKALKADPSQTVLQL